MDESLRERELSSTCMECSIADMGYFMVGSQQRNFAVVREALIESVITDSFDA